MKKIVVIGAGPAGVVCSIILKKLGFEVVLFSNKRPFEAIEGLSQRTDDALENASCFESLKTIKEKVKRKVQWNDEESEKNHEYVVYRDEFDEALLKDAKNFNIQIIKEKVNYLDIDSSLVKSKNYCITCDFIVDARGRFSQKNKKLKSPKTKSFLIKLPSFDNSYYTFTKSTNLGWIWNANMKNIRYFQLTTNLKDGKAQIVKLLNLNTSKSKDIKIRDASSYLSKNLVKNNYIKIGDCACAVDPLSGNGVFQALSSAFFAPYVINTLLNSNKDNKKASKKFYKKRIQDMFYRYASKGKEFYSLEKRFKNSFWQERSAWPKEKISKLRDNEIKLKQKAILEAPFIKKHEVIVTKESPLGIWRMGRINLVYVVKNLKILPKEKQNLFLEEYIIDNHLSKIEKNYLISWCLKYKLIEL